MSQLSDDLYQRYRELLRARLGIDYSERKRADLAHSLSLALSVTGHSGLAALYADALGNGPGWEAIVAQVTVGETYFFRNSAQFDALRRQLLPELLARREATRGLRLWSAGCATGEEPYSIAMLLADTLPAAEGWQTSILASDINPHFLARAREGLYGAWSFRETPEATRARFFREEAGRWRLVPEIRRMVSFIRLNLAEPSYPAIANGTCALDIIFCRNVTIYFDEATTRQVIERFYGALAPGGWLIVGHAEPQINAYRQFETHNFPDTIVYRKPLSAPLFAFDSASGTFTAGTRPLLASARDRARPAPLPQPYQPAPRPTLQAPLPAVAAPAEQPPDVLATLFARARMHADQGEWAQAERACTELLGRDKLHVEGHFLLAQIYEHQGRLDDALASYRRCGFLDRGFVLGTLGMAEIWRQMGQLEDARRAYRSALKQLATLDPAAEVAAADGATALDLTAIARRQLAALDG
jgi:chemotaxis protein methyltransferase CheR